MGHGEISRSTGRGRKPRDQAAHAVADEGFEGVEVHGGSRETEGGICLHGRPTRTSHCPRVCAGCWLLAGCRRMISGHGKRLPVMARDHQSHIDTISGEFILEATTPVRLDWV